MVDGELSKQRKIKFFCAKEFFANGKGPAEKERKKERKRSVTFTSN